MIIRPFRYTDLDALVHLAQISFAEELVAQGTSQEAFLQQIRTATRGRMIPFKVVAAFTGTHWGLLVAEVDGQVVGCGGYLGQGQRVELANLMVAPEHRRRGIGQALLVTRLKELAQQGYASVTTTVLATNEASLGNLRKQGFASFDQYSLFESALPFPESMKAETAISARRVSPGDKGAFRALETDVFSPELLRVDGTTLPYYFPTFPSESMSKLTGGQRWVRAFEHGGSLIGFLHASSTKGQSKGTIARPLVHDEHLKMLPAMLREAGVWLGAQNKTSALIRVSQGRESLVQLLEEEGWMPRQSWVRLIKKLDTE